MRPVTTDLRSRRARPPTSRLLVLDVDGVLTDGRLHITAQGEETKVFHVRDGSGIVAVQRAGITVAIISGRDSAAVTRRANELGIRHVFQGISDKRAALDAAAGRTGCHAGRARLRRRRHARRADAASAPRWPSPWPTRTQRRVPPRTGPRRRQAATAP